MQFLRGAGHAPDTGGPPRLSACQPLPHIRPAQARGRWFRQDLNIRPLDLPLIVPAGRERIGSFEAFNPGSVGHGNPSALRVVPKRRDRCRILAGGRRQGIGIRPPLKSLPSLHTIRTSIVSVNVCSRRGPRPGSGHLGSRMRAPGDRMRSARGCSLPQTRARNAWRCSLPFSARSGFTTKTVILFDGRPRQLPPVLSAGSRPVRVRRAVPAHLGIRGHAVVAERFAVPVGAFVPLEMVRETQSLPRLVLTCPGRGSLHRRSHARTQLQQSLNHAIPDSCGSSGT